MTKKSPKKTVKKASTPKRKRGPKRVVPDALVLGAATSFTGRTPRRAPKLDPINLGVGLALGLALNLLFVSSGKASSLSVSVDDEDEGEDEDEDEDKNEDEKTMIDEPSAPDLPTVNTVTTGSGSRAITTISSFPGWKRGGTTLPSGAVVAANQAITEAKGKDPQTLVGTVFKITPTYAVLYEQHYNESKGVHLGATVYVPKT